jgi:hypothetical protein
MAAYISPAHSFRRPLSRHPTLSLHLEHIGEHDEQAKKTNCSVDDAGGDYRYVI